MKNVTIVLFAIIFSLQAFAQKSNDTIISNNNQNLKVKVLYFHITNRCHTCFSIEAAVNKTINENFKTELEKGFIALYIVNCDLPENKELSVKYDAYGSTLAVTKILGDTEKTEDLTSFAFSKIYNESIFISELKLKIQELIKE